MIPKKREEYFQNVGAGRPFEMNERYPIEKNDAERQVPKIINLADLNGQTYPKGMPKNFLRDAGRVLPSFTKYWSPEELKAEQDEGYDVQ